jgi:putative hydrolase of the HAD superfamily
VIFDFDGLLMDTETTLLRSWQHEWQQWGLELDVATFFADHGGDLNPERTALLAAAVGPSYDADLSLRRRLKYRAELQRVLDLSDGIRAWIDEAVAMSVRVAVASSSPVAWLEENLDRAGVYEAFDVVAGGDEVERHKPYPDVYELALGRLGLTPLRAVAVEDTAHGVDAAHAAGMRCVAIPNPYVDPMRVRHADVVLRSASELSLAETLERLSD